MEFQGCMLLHCKLFFPGIWNLIFFLSFSLLRASVKFFCLFFSNNHSIPEFFKLYLPSTPHVSNVRDTVWASVSPSACSLLQFIPGKTLCSCIVLTPQGWSVLHRALMRGISIAHQPAKVSTQTLISPRNTPMCQLPWVWFPGGQVWLWIHVHVVHWGAALKKNLWGSKEQ